ncbi:hypothetical protein A4A49_51625 [Nicotiana attenuata]|uniref:Uncharacterized protein n=1 Tax=Nicotiana attenuata TaxID=49451 RepID=A0A314L8Y9_NICAT|nr:hypothetical protein A4A49_51625 [Nicotiana attenuata]
MRIKVLRDEKTVSFHDDETIEMDKYYDLLNMLKKVGYLQGAQTEMLLSSLKLATVTLKLQKIIRRLFYELVRMIWRIENDG